MGEVIRMVSEKTNDDAIMVTDVGQHQMIAARYFKFKHHEVALLPVDWEPWVLDFRQHWAQNWGT